MAGASERHVRDGLTTVTLGTGALLGATLVLILLNFLSRVLVINNLSPADWNAFSLGFTLAQVLIAVGSFGIPLAAARALPYTKTDAERRTVVRTSVLTGLVAATVSGVSLAASAGTLARVLGDPRLGFGLEMFAIAVASTIASLVLASLFQGFADVLPNALFVQVVNPGLFLASILFALWVVPREITYPIALLGYAGASAVTFVVLALYAARRLPARVPPAPADPMARRRFLEQLAPLAVVGAFTSIAGSGDTLVLGAEQYAQVGPYTVGLTLARLVQVGIAAASYIFLPVAARFLARGNTAAVRLTYATVTKWLTVFSLPLFAMFFFLPGPSLDFVFRGTYASAAGPVEIVVVGAFLATLLGPASVTQVALGDSRLVAYNSLVACAADLLLALWLVPRYGWIGAAVAWSAATAAFTAMCVGELALRQRIHPLGRDFLLPLLLTVVPVGVVLELLPVRPGHLLLPALGLLIALAYVLAIVLTRSIGDGDRLLLESIEEWTHWRIPLVRSLARLRRPGRSGRGLRPGPPGGGRGGAGPSG